MTKAVMFKNVRQVYIVVWPVAPRFPEDNGE